MKRFIRIMAICFLSFLFLTSSNAQNTIPGLVPPSNGPVGLSPSGSPFAPVQLLDVNQGNINIQPSSGSFSFMLDGTPFLWNNGVSTNTLVGWGAAPVTTGTNNTAVGNGALNNCTNLLMNTAIGYQSLFSANSCPLCWDGKSTINTAVGFQALYSTQAYGGCALGWRAGYSNIDGCSLVAIGENAALHNTIGDDNVAIGEGSMINNTTLNNNTAVGTDALSGQSFTNSVKTDGYNSAFGRSALVNNNPSSTSNGIFNTGLGSFAGDANVTGTGNTYVGYQADALSSGLNNTTAVGNGALVAKDNNMILGGRDVKVGVGLSGVSTGVFAKLDVLNDASNFPAKNSTVAGQFITNGSGQPATSYFGVFGQAYPKTSPWNNIGGSFTAWNCQSNNIGVTGDADGTAGTDAIGGRFLVQNASQRNYGVIGTATSTLGKWNAGGVFSANGVSQSAANFGVSAHSENGYVNFGVFSTVNPTYTPTMPWPVDIAVYAQIQPSLAHTPNPIYAGYFDGDVFINCPTCGTNFAQVISDAMFKTRIDSISSAMSIIKQLNPKTYYLDTLNKYGIRFSNKKQIGFLAQDVEKVLPNLIVKEHKPEMVDSAHRVVTEGVDYKAISYDEFIPLLVQGLKESGKTIDNLKTNSAKQDSVNSFLQTQIKDLRSIITDCCNNSNHQMQQGNNNSNSNGQNNIGKIDVKLTDAQSIVLDQNVPNPFAEQTSINYFLTDDVSKAQMLFYNAGGKLIQSIELTQRGQQQLNVFAQDLTNGMYSYTLVVDGKIFDTKKMVKQ